MSLHWAAQQISSEGPTLSEEEQINNLLEVEGDNYTVAHLHYDEETDIETIFPYKEFESMPGSIVVDQAQVSSYFTGLEEDLFPRLFRTEAAATGLIQRILQDERSRGLELIPVKITDGKAYGGFYTKDNQGVYQPSIFYRENKEERLGFSSRP